MICEHIHPNCAQIPAFVINRWNLIGVLAGILIMGLKNLTLLDVFYRLGPQLIIFQGHIIDGFPALVRSKYLLRDPVYIRNRRVTHSTA